MGTTKVDIDGAMVDRRPKRGIVKAPADHSLVEGVLPGEGVDDEVDAKDRFVGTLPFEDAQIEGWWYNGEVPSRVADVDGDGRPEIVFPRQNGRLMVIKKRAAD